MAPLPSTLDLMDKKPEPDPTFIEELEEWYDLDEIDPFGYWYSPAFDHPTSEEEAIDRFWAGTE